MATERSPRQLRLLTALLLFGMFLLGAVAGIGFSRWDHPPHRPHHHLPFLPGPPEALKLTPEQEAKAHAITTHYRPQLEAILRESFPKVQAINEQMEKELRQILTPEQSKLLDEMKARRPPLPPGGPMPPGLSGGPHLPPPLGGQPPPWPPGPPPTGEALP
jgi:hypothetical protein